MRYRADIDGLRAFAVLAVLLFHAGVGPFRGGFVGVDVFFVISGFLITGMIVGDAEQGRFSLLRFYERRARRILPALFVMIAIVGLIASLYLIPHTFAAFGASAAAAALSASNIFFWATSEGYFDMSAAQAPLLHTWSLGVEEQFYIFYPLYLMLMHRFTRWSWARIIALLIAASFLCNLVLTALSPTAAFYLPIGRMWELALGGLLAVGAVPALTNARLREASAWLGLLLLIGSALLLDEHAGFPGVAVLAPCAGAALLIHSNAAPTLVSRVLSWKPLVFIGLISYSLYLWHWPLLVLSASVLGRQLAPMEAVPLLALSFVLAVLSWRYVELPVRRRAVLPTRRLVFAASAVAMACIGLSGAGVSAARGAPGRFAPQIQTIAWGAEDINADRLACRLDEARLARGDVCVLGARAARPSVAILGDSYADAFAPGIARAADEAGVAAKLYLRPGCVPLPGVGERSDACRRFNDAVVRDVMRDADIRSIVLIGRWPGLVEGSRFGAMRRAERSMRDDQTLAPSYAENQRVFARGIQRTLAVLPGRDIYVLAYVPEQPVLAPQAATSRALLGLDPATGLSRAAFEARQARVRQALESVASSRLHVLDASRYLCTRAQCPLVSAGVSNYFDDNHVSRTAALRMRAVFAPAFARRPAPRAGQYVLVAAE